MELLSVNAAVATAKTAIEMARALQNVDSTVEKAELKLKIAELVESLAELRHQLVSVEEGIRDREQTIDELYEALENKATVIKKGDAYYRDEDHAFSDPYCLHCWDRDHKLYHLRSHQVGTNFFQKCGICNATFTID